MEILEYYESDFWTHLGKSNIIPTINGRLQWARLLGPILGKYDILDSRKL